MPEPVPVKILGGFNAKGERIQEWISPEGRTFLSGDRRNCAPAEADKLVADKIAEKLPSMLIRVKRECSDGISRALREGAVAKVETALATRLFTKGHAVEASEADLAEWEKFLEKEAAEEAKAAKAAEAKAAK